LPGLPAHSRLAKGRFFYFYAMQIDLPQGKKIYFASDFHLGVPDGEASLAREKRIVAWLDQIKADAHSIYLLGDIFDFWFEYRQAIPKGFIRLQGKLAQTHAPKRYVCGRKSISK